MPTYTLATFGSFWHPEAVGVVEDGSDLLWAGRRFKPGLNPGKWVCEIWTLSCWCESVHGEVQCETILQQSGKAS